MCVITTKWVHFYESQRKLIEKIVFYFRNGRLFCNFAAFFVAELVLTVK